MRQLYSPNAAISTLALNASLAGNSVGSIQSSSAGIRVDFYDGASSTELSTAQGICTAAPYNLSLLSTDATIFSQSWMPIDMANVQCWFDPGHASVHLWQEGNAGIALTSAVVGAPVGQLDDSAPPAHVWLTAANRPTLQTDGAPECHVSFVRASSQRMTIKNSASAFQFLNTTGIGTIAVWVRSQADGVAQILFDSSGGSSSNSGLFVEKDASNHIIVLVTKGSAGNVVYSYTTTGTLLVADGWQWLIITLTPGTLTSRVEWQPKNVSETFTNSTAVGGGAAPGDLALAATSSASTTPGSWDVRAIVIKSDVITAAERTKLLSMTAPRSTTTQSLLRLSGRTITNFVRGLFRLDAPTDLWQDTGRSSAITTDGQTVALVDNYADPTRVLNRAFSQSTAAQRPIYRDGTGASLLAGLEFNGLDANTSDLHYAETGVAGGAQTWLEIMRNTHVNVSSAAYAAAGNHFPVSGASNPGNLIANGGPGEPYLGIHTSLGGIVRAGLTSDPTAWQILEVSRFGGNFEARVSQGGTNMPSNAVPSHDYVGSGSANNANAAGGMGIAELGLAGAGAGTAFGGWLALFVVWTTRLTRAQRDLYLYPFLTQRYPTIPLQPGT